MEQQYKIDYLGTEYSGTRPEFVTALGPCIAAWHDEDDEFQTEQSFVDAALEQLEPITDQEATTYPRIAENHLAIITNELEQAAEMLGLPKGAFEWCRIAEPHSGDQMVRFAAWGKWCDLCRFQSTAAAIAAIAKAIQATQIPTPAPVETFWKTLRAQAGYIRTVRAQRVTA